MERRKIAQRVCFARLGADDNVLLVGYDNGHYGILRNGRPIVDRCWEPDDVQNCAKTFLRYVRLEREGITSPVAP